MENKIFIKRIIASSVDLFVIGLLDIVISLTILRFGLNNSVLFNYLTLSNQMRAYSFLINIELYFIISELLFGKTFGKKILGLQIVTLENTKITFFQILTRNLFRITDQLLLIGSCTAIFDKKRRRLGDLLSKTVIVNKSSLSN